MTADEQRLIDNGWVQYAPGSWTLTKALEGYNSKNQLLHVPAGVTRDLAGALELESIRPTKPDLVLKASAAATSKEAAGRQIAMEVLAKQTTTSVPDVGAPTTMTPTGGQKQ